MFYDWIDLLIKADKILNTKRGRAEGITKERKVYTEDEPWVLSMTADFTFSFNCKL